PSSATPLVCARCPGTKPSEPCIPQSFAAGSRKLHWGLAGSEKMSPHTESAPFMKRTRAEFQTHPGSGHTTERCTVESVSKPLCLCVFVCVRVCVCVCVSPSKQTAV